jgi:HD-GYP domain-containing protein (c-di-GMP phosphodiesterase class II)
MTSDRPYREARTLEEAGRELKRLSGKQFDPTIVSVFFSIPDSEWNMQAINPVAQDPVGHKTER